MILTPTDRALIDRLLCREQERLRRAAMAEPVRELAIRLAVEHAGVVELWERWGRVSLQQ